MLHICCRKIRFIAFVLIAGLCLCASVDSQAQIRGNRNYNKFQQKPFYFGAALGFNSAFFKVQHSDAFIANGDYEVVQAIKGLGYNIGVIGNLKIGEYFDVRTLLNFSFVNRQIDFLAAETGSATKERLESVFLEIPFLVRFKSDPYRDKRVFLVAGVKYNYDLSNKNAKFDDNVNIKLAAADFQAELGAGMQFFMPFFIFSPEIKFSQGLGNILYYSDISKENTLLERILSRTITITFNIEG